MKYCDLREYEKNELRETLWHESCVHDGYTDYDYLSAEQQLVVDNCKTWEEIPEEIMEAAYGVYDFVEEDFFCNIYDDCEKEDSNNEA